MKPFHSLSQTGKLRRLHALASVALTEYDLRDTEFSYHGFETNLMYRIRDRTGRRLMLRLASPGWRSYDNLVSEALWLDALARDTSVRAPEVIPSCDGRRVVPVSVEGVPTPWNATLMTWVPGRLLGGYLSERNLAKMGALFAELHDHGLRWQRPMEFSEQRFEHWLSRGEPNLLAGPASGDGASGGGHSADRAAGTTATPIPADHREVLTRLSRHVEDAYAVADSRDLRVIHCDLWHDNIKLYKGTLYPFDFEDTILGYRAHDIAMAMLDLLEVSDEDRYQELVTAFRNGYAAFLRWPEEPIEPFQIGRLLWKLNWIARHQPQWLSVAVKRHRPLFEMYEKTGQVRKPPV